MDMLCNLLGRRKRLKAGLIGCVLFALGVLLIQKNSVPLNVVKNLHTLAGPQRLTGHTACAEEFARKPSSLSADRWVLVVTGKSQPGQDAVVKLLGAGYGVVLLTVGPMSPSFHLKHLEKWTPQQLRLIVIDGKRKCTKRILTDLFKMKQISAVHMYYDEADFPSDQDSKDVGIIVRCHIDLLEAIAGNKYVSVNMHIRKQNHIVESKYRDKLQTGIPVTTQMPPAAKTVNWRTCVIHYEEGDHQDVFLKSLDLYVGTYQRLYNININKLIS